MNDTEFAFTFENFNEGNAPLSHIDDKTFIGDQGQSSDAKADLISLPGFITQSPALTNLTNGTEAGVVSQLIRHILDKPTANDTTYAIGTTKLFKLSSTAVVSGGSPSWPQTVTTMASGESVIRMKTNLYGFYNTASVGDILKMPLDGTDVIDNDWGSSTDTALEKAPHPSATKEDILIFGNGRYVGVYLQGESTMDVKKLDFGEGAEVADIAFNSNFWWIAVNYADGKRSQIFLYDPSALSSQLADEAGVGDQKIGFLYVLNGILFIAYQDKTSEAFILGWLSGRQIKPLRYFSGSLPDHRQKALYKNTILFLSDSDVWSCGAPVQQLPIQISKLASGGYDDLGAIASPFGVPLISSTDGDTHFSLAKFSGYSVDSEFKTILVDLTKLSNLGKITKVIVQTKALGSDAKAHLTIEGNQGAEESSAFEISGANKTRHIFTSIDLTAVEDARVAISYAEGDDAQTVPIRKIIISGNYAER